MREFRTDIIKIVRNKDTPDEVTFEDIQCDIQPEKGFFDINADIKKGDILIVPDLDEPKIVIKKKVYNKLSPHIEAELLDLSEFEEKNNKSDSFSQISVTNSSGVVIGSSNVSVNIQDSFNKIYRQLEDENPENKDEIKQKVDELKEELEKEEVNKTKVQRCYEWLKSNANWTVPTITQIITASMFGAG